MAKQKVWQNLCALYERVSRIKRGKELTYTVGCKQELSVDFEKGPLYGKKGVD